MIAGAFDEAEARDPGRPRAWVVLAGGAGPQLDLVRAEAARRGVTIHIIIDIIQVASIGGVRPGASTRPGPRSRGLGRGQGMEGAEAVLTLRAVISNGDFEEYWRFHLDCEQQRLYPALSRDNTRSAPDRPAHSKRATPIAIRQLFHF